MTVRVTHLFIGEFPRYGMKNIPFIVKRENESEFYCERNSSSFSKDQISQLENCREITPVPENMLLLEEDKLLWVDKDGIVFAGSCWEDREEIGQYDKFLNRIVPVQS